MFLMAKAVVPFMRNRGWGRIVNQASSIVTMAAPGFVHYIASKSAVIGFTRSLATELGPDGITVNAIAPGLVRTPSTLKRSGRSYPGLTEEQEFEMVRQMQVIKRVEVPDDLVGALAFLVSADAGFITGQTYYIDGGMTRS
jgi:NAD(P)-dependent dehydrogenase (short-subunit alcohol dehydrogenase family)